MTLSTESCSQTTLEVVIGTAPVPEAAPVDPVLVRINDWRADLTEIRSLAERASRACVLECLTAAFEDRLKQGDAFGYLFMETIRERHGASGHLRLEPPQLPIFDRETWRDLTHYRRDEPLIPRIDEVLATCELEQRWAAYSERYNATMVTDELHRQAVAWWWREFVSRHRPVEPKKTKSTVTVDMTMYHDDFWSNYGHGSMEELERLANFIGCFAHYRDPSWSPSAFRNSIPTSRCHRRSGLPGQSFDVHDFSLRCYKCKVAIKMSHPTYDQLRLYVARYRPSEEER